MKTQEKAAHKQDQARRKARKNQALTHAQRAKLHTLVTARLYLMFSSLRSVTFVLVAKMRCDFILH